MRSCVLFGLLLMLAAVPCLADTAGPSADRPPVFVEVEPAGGLPQTSVEVFHRDRHGFLWIGTQGGLARWDGHRLRVFRRDPRDPDSLPGNNIRALAEDAAGRLWVGTLTGGVAMIEPGSGLIRRYGTDQGLASDKVSALAVDAAGRVWVGHAHSGLSVIEPDDQRARVFARAWGGDGSRTGVTALLATDGGLWIGGQKGLSYLAAGSEQPRIVDLGEDPAADRFHLITGLHRDAEGRIRAAGSSGLWIGSRPNAAFRPLPLPLDEGLVPALRGISPDGAGGYWLASRHGLIHYPTGNRSPRLYQADAEDPASLPHESLRTVYRDPVGQVWLGSDTQGMAALMRMPEGVDRLPVRRRGSIVSAWALAHHDGALWAGTSSDGVLRLDDDGDIEAAYLVEGPDRRGRNIWSLASGPAGLWVATDDLSIYRIRDEDGGVEDHGVALARIDPGRVEALWDLHVDGRGRLWITTNGDGLHRYDPESGEVRVWRADNEADHGLGDDRLTYMHRGPDGQLWIGTEGDGLYVLDPDMGRFRHVAAGPDGLPGRMVEVIRHDSQGRLWIGTYDGGVARLGPDGDIRLFGHAQGMPSDTIVGLEVDAGDRAWVMTATGLVRIAPDGTIQRLGQVEGVPEMTVFSGAHTRDDDGRPVFAGSSGLLRIDVDRINPANASAPLRFTGLRVMGEQRWGGDVSMPQAIWDRPRLTLAHDEPAFSVDFSLMDLRNPASHQYRYRLAGFDADWQYTGAERATATYTNLNPGDYQLEVAVQGRDGRWQSIDQPLMLTVQPPPWQHPAAMLAYLLLAGTSVGGGGWLWRRRLQREAALKRSREQERWIRRLHELATHLAEPADRATLLRRFLGRLVELLPVDAAAVRLEPSGQLPALRVDYPEDSATPMSSSDPGFESVTIATRRGALGWLYVRPRAGHVFSDRDRAALAACADQTGQALENALLLEEADSANRAKSAFLAKLSHEIRTPISGMLGLSGLLLRESLDERSRDYARAIQSSGRGLMAILSDILDNARLQAGRMELNPAPFDVVAAVEDTAALYASQAMSRGVTVVTHVDAGIPRRIETDEVRFRQILGNLLSNAVKFTREGAVTVHLQPMDAERLRLRVRDTGPGMTRDAVERLFQPFSRVESGQSVEGSGLGLVICRDLARLMGGEVRLDTRPGEGSCFEVTFRAERLDGERSYPASRRSVVLVGAPGPARDMLADRISANGMPVTVEAQLPASIPEGAMVLVCQRDGVVPMDRSDWLLDWPVREQRLAQMLDRLAGLGESDPSDGAADAEAGAVVSGATVLLAEDNPVNARVARDVLETAGYRVYRVEDGAAALQALNTADYDIVLMDRHMPGMDGLAATRAIRDHGWRMPVIGLTAAVAEEEHNACLQAGMDSVVVKDGDPGPMLAALARAIGKETEVPSLQSEIGGRNVRSP